MLTVSPLAVNTTSRNHNMAADFADFTTEGLPDFRADEGSLDVLEGIDFYDDLFIDEFDGNDVLPGLEILGEYSGSEGNTSAAWETSERGGGASMDKTVRKGKRKGKKSKDRLSNDNGIKKKPKVDWTPDLHRKFVKAVEKLGIDKAVPSRILEIMNVTSLNRHNVASHLQKYRSHRKHIQAREAEAACWNLQRHATVAVAGVGGENKLCMAHPLGYPPPLHQHQCHFRPFHVWGHPTWPKPKPNHPSSSSTHRIPPAPSCCPGHPPFWHLQPLYPQGYGMASSNHSSIGVPTRQLGPTNPPVDIHPSNESIDAAIGDVITKPWLPLPLGLNPPSVDGVMTELQRQGISDVPPLP